MTRHVLMTWHDVSQTSLPDLIALFSPIVSAYIQTQEEVLSTFVVRALEAETWQPVGEEVL